MVVNAVNLNWQNIPLTYLLKDRYNLPVSILNDCQAAAIGEKTYGVNYQNDENMVLLKVHNGIGAGIIINGSVYHGDGGFAGEIGHIVMKRDGGDLCRCGNRGCLETVASTQALVKHARKAIEKHPQSILPHDPERNHLGGNRGGFQIQRLPGNKPGSGNRSLSWKGNFWDCRNAEYPKNRSGWKYDPLRNPLVECHPV